MIIVYHHKKKLNFDNVTFYNSAPKSKKITYYHTWHTIAIQHLIFMESGGQPHKNPFLSTLRIWNQNWKILVSICLFIYLFIYLNLVWIFPEKASRINVDKLKSTKSCFYQVASISKWCINFHFLHKNAGFSKIMGSGDYPAHFFQSLFFKVHYHCAKFRTSSLSLPRDTGRGQSPPHLPDMHGPWHARVF